MSTADRCQRSAVSGQTHARAARLIRELIAERERTATHVEATQCADHEKPYYAWRASECRADADALREAVRILTTENTEMESVKSV